MDPVGLVTVHHEGAGAPSDNVLRFADGGYCYGIGITRWVRFRSPAQNWATKGFNHKDLTICLSGNRMDHEVTDSDIVLIHGAFMDCFGRREVDPRPQVRAHRNSPGSSTACPGNRTMARWSDVEAACRAVAPQPKPPEVKVKPQFDPPRQLEFVSMLRIDPPDPEAGSWGMQPDWGVITLAGGFHGTMFGTDAIKGRTPALIVKAGTVVAGAKAPLSSYPDWAVYECIATSGERYLPRK